ncbi:hypothetical protein CPB84DRAFT_1734543 [Gymnopilus junonius]|uniref:F-box domain-containing protein n=1 Tax=Gymnopilus junonius TaxID=109634 RepID=A0A9P5NFU6_GYMJU|nr:hypothetical protein CPB84DRAFT_1734543 [Gymnopilus junonius]
MSSLQTKLHNKTRERDACQSIILQYHHLLSPLGLLPNDILAIIFGYCLPDSRCATFNTNEPPILLSLICRHWQLVAYNSPELWASLHIQFPSYTDSPDSEYIRPHFQVQVIHHQAAISQWLYHSGSFPLSISLYLLVNSYSAPIEYYQGYLDILLSVTH